MNAKKVWFVTGASKGLGLAIAKKLLQEGYRVTATSRKTKEFPEELMQSSNFLPLTMELTDEQNVAQAINRSLDKFGSIDVVVNNAGYGQLGTLEELTDAEARQNFDVNVFGLLNVIRHIMPHFRSQKSGYVINISSIAGFMGTFPGWGIYDATKFAVTGFTEALSAETKSLGIHTTVVYPGYFRTNFLSQSSLRTAKNPIADYKEARDLETAHLNGIDGTQPGDPDKAAAAFIQLAESKEPPLHFFMGSDSFGMAGKQIEILKGELEANESLSKSTDF